MSRQEYYEYSKTYEYSEGIPDGVNPDELEEEIPTRVGEVTWSADIDWNEALGQYNVSTYWTDHGNNFSDLGEGPMREEFMDDLSSYLGSQGIQGDDYEVMN